MMNAIKPDSREYARQVRGTLFWVLVANIAVAAAKLVVGSMIRSASMIADGYHSFSDGSSNIIGLLGMRIAGQPKDYDHPYGHKKYETFASVFIALLLFLLCFHILHDTLQNWKTAQAPRVDLSGFAVMLGTLVVNGTVMLYEYRRGKKIGSDILVADSLHTRADILTSLSVLAAFVAVKMGFPIADRVAALIICGFIAYSAWGIVRSTSAILCDTAVIDPLEIERLVARIPGVLRCHRVRTRGRKDDIHIDLHVLLKDDTPLLCAHELSSEIERRLEAFFPGVTDVVVHLEPLSSEEEGGHG